MLYHLLYEWLYRTNPSYSVLNVFQYVTFRTAYASLTALALGLIMGPWLIHRLQLFQIGQQIREEGPSHHQVKAGTPTMGGILIVVSTVLPTFLWADLTNSFTWVVLVSIVGFGAIGFADDYIKIVKRRSLGLTGRTKLVLQFSLSFAIGLALVWMSAARLYKTNLIVPFFKQFTPSLILEGFLSSPYLYLVAFLPFLIFISIVIVGSSNTVNLTDGLDGLAIGCVIIASSALTVLTYVTGHARFASYLDIQHLPQVSEVTIFCGALVGASLGFLWYNCHPAEVFMGDVGSLALGGAIGTIAVLIKQEILLVAIGGVFVAEGLSVMIQVASFKLRGKRVFKMAPLHHHFELLGWKETKVVVRFWIGALIFALFSLTTLKLR
ncbi:MAG: phospho-N-acetylmuramoyl-pentapeptide-transferase [Acidobacteria bacterium]|nr:phospho-N-acetylmuramoyl-pentapeptide-transferase [Acidobacteriota bacterium]MCI0621324.1 phospho-N-acetylmuramoyl-pentapeptide-transferase [Acidobacteriota bacterium]MCI0720130.1 phospho-N-acetylmuramoyl-pentapeptide-transferase [Acidobacteriota bacterium]